MVKHIVMFKFSGSENERKEVASQFKTALDKLPGVIEVLKRMEVGLNVNPNESWDLVLTAVVETLEDVDTYANHPAHVAAGAIIKNNKDSRACVDYVF